VRKSAGREERTESDESMEDLRIGGRRGLERKDGCGGRMEWERRWKRWNLRSEKRNDIDVTCETIWKSRKGDEQNNISRLH
jgi:hypothetical protein